MVVGDVDQRQQVCLVDTTRAGSLAGAPIMRVPDSGCWFTNVAYQPAADGSAVVEECHVAGAGRGQVLARSRLLFFDPSSRRLLARSLVLTVAGLPDVFSLSFDTSRRYLLDWAGQIVVAAAARPAGGRSAGEVEAVGDGGGLAAVGYPQLGQDVGHVHAGRLGADEQGVGDLAVGAAVGQQGEHFPLARGEAELGPVGLRRGRAVR